MAINIKENGGKDVCPPDIRGLILNMDYIMQNPKYNHAGTPTQIACDLLKSERISSFSQFKNYLRQSGSRSHLFAVDLDFFGPDFLVIYPTKRDERPKYALYVTVNGNAEAEMFRDKIATTAEENLQRLKTTGVLTPRSVN